MHRAHRIYSSILLAAVSLHAAFAAPSKDPDTSSDLPITSAVIAKSDTSVDSVAWASNDEYFATTWNNTVILWSASTNTIVSVYTGHNAIVEKIRFSQDNNWLLSIGKDNTIIIRDIDSQSGVSKIMGTGLLPVHDAVFVRNGYSIMSPLDGFNTSYCYRLLATDQFLSKVVTESAAPIFSLDISRDGSLLLTGSQDGTVFISDTFSGKIIRSYPRYAKSNIPPVFSPDGSRFLSAADRTSLVISPVNGNGAQFIRDSDQPVNSAIFSPDGKKIAVALKNGSVKIYNASNGSELNHYTVDFNGKDVVKSLAFSPDAEFLLAGTQNGYVFRWSINGKKITPVPKSYLDKDMQNLAAIYSGESKKGGKKGSGGGSDGSGSAEGDGEGDNTNALAEGVFGEKKPPIPSHQIFFEAGGSTLNSDYFIAAIEFQGGYRNFMIYPFFMGGNLKLSAGFPGNDFPYEYRVGSTTVNAPWLYTLAPSLTGGVCRYIEKWELLTYVQVDAAATMRVLCSNGLDYLVTSSVFSGASVGLTAGFQWYRLKFDVGIDYDTNLGVLIRGGVGFAHFFGKKVQEPVEGEL